jgi:hypothetical protein
MKVKCVSTKSSEIASALHYNFITIDKIYETLETSDYYYSIIGDNDRESKFYKGCFITIEELREEKLKELGI